MTMAPGVLVVGPRPVAAPFPGLSAGSQELQRLGSGELTVMLMVTIDPSGLVKQVRLGYVRGLAFDATLVAELESIVAQWRFYPEMFDGNTQAEEHSVMFILGEATPEGQP